MIRFEPRASAPLTFVVAVRLAALAAAFALAAIPLAAAGAPVGRAFWLMLEGAGGTLFAATETLTRATPLILTGLAAAVAFRARLFNIGAEGQLYAGALATVAIGSGAVEGSTGLLVPLVLTAAAAAGAALMFVPTVLKVRLGVDEVVTTLLLNFVVLLFVQMMLEGPLKDPMGGGWPQSQPVLDEAVLPPLVERMRLHAGLLIGIVACIAAHNREPSPHHGARKLRSRGRLLRRPRAAPGARSDRGDPAEIAASGGGPPRSRDRRRSGAYLAPSPRRTPCNGRRGRLRAHVWVNSTNKPTYWLNAPVRTCPRVPR
jgi:hypothetical protein